MPVYHRADELRNFHRTMAKHADLAKFQGDIWWFGHAVSLG